MRMALLILCLISAPSPSPANPKSTDTTQSKPQTNAQPSKSSPSAVTEKQTTANTTDQKSGTAASAPTERAVRIVGYPPRSAGDTVALVCSVLLTLAGIIGIIVAICTLSKVREQARETAKSAKSTADSVEAINGQARIMETQFAISHRPWCGFPESPKAVSVLRFDNDGGHLEVSCKVRNGSNTAPAMGVNIVQSLLASLTEAPDLRSLKQELEQLAPTDFINHITRIAGVPLLLPDNITDFPPATVKMPQDVFNSIQGKKITLFLILCVAYRDEFDDVHRTGTAYRFVTNYGLRSFQAKDGTIPGSFEAFGAGYAD